MTCTTAWNNRPESTLMAHRTSSGQRLLLAGISALAFSAVPAMAALTVPAAGPALAACPLGEVLDNASGACKPGTMPSVAPTLNPLDPEKVKLQPGELTSSLPGDVGTLPEVNGIPCNSNAHGGGSTGECIGLEQSSGAKVQEGHAAG